MRGLSLGLRLGAQGEGALVIYPPFTLTFTLYDDTTEPPTYNFETDGIFNTAEMFLLITSDNTLTTGAEVEAEVIAQSGVYQSQTTITMGDDDIPAPEMADLPTGNYTIYAVARMPGSGLYTNVEIDPFNVLPSVPSVYSIDYASIRRNEQGTSPSYTAPAANAGDLGVVTIAHWTNIAISGPPGYTRINSIYNPNEGIRCDVFAKEFTAPEASQTVAWTIEDVAWAAAMQHLRDVDNAIPLAVAASATKIGTAQTLASPSIAGANSFGAVLYSAGNGRGEGLDAATATFGLIPNDQGNPRPDQTSIAWHNNTSLTTLGVHSVLHPHDASPTTAIRNGGSWQTTNWAQVIIGIGERP